jgi:hypothetical protein
LQPEQVNGSGVKIGTAHQYDEASNLTLKTNPFLAGTL